MVVVDEAGKFAIPVLSGHLGGANALAGRLASGIGAVAVLTTASDSQQTLAVDLLGRELGWVIEATHDELVRASAAVVNDEAVALVQEAGEADWWTRHANGRQGTLPANLRTVLPDRGRRGRTFRRRALDQSARAARRLRRTARRQVRRLPPAKSA